MLISEEELERKAAELRARLSEREIGYIAGLTDGEGSFKIRRYRPTNYYTPVVEIANTNSEILNYFQSKLKIGKIYIHKQRTNHREVYSWFIQGIEALIFSKAFLDTLFIKRAQAELILKFTDMLGRKGSRVPPEITRRRDGLYWQLRALNIRGYIRPFGPTALAPSIPVLPSPLKWSLPRSLSLLDA